MISKTLEEWKKEVEQLSSIYYEMYAVSLNDKRCNKAMVDNYSAAAKNNWDLKDVLFHIQKYGSPINFKRCASCRNNEPNHNNRLQQTYAKYSKWINQAIVNGFNSFGEEKVPASFAVHSKIMGATKSTIPIGNFERMWDNKNNCWQVRPQAL